MARRTDPNRVAINKGGAPPKYPWHKWMDGSCWRLREGSDYTITTKSFRQAVYRHASRTGHTARVLRVPNGLTIQFTPKEGK